MQLIVSYDRKSSEENIGFWDKIHFALHKNMRSTEEVRAVWFVGDRISKFPRWSIDKDERMLYILTRSV